MRLIQSRTDNNFIMRIVILGDPLDNQKAGVHYYTKELLQHLGEGKFSHDYHVVRLRRDPKIRGVKQKVVPNYPWIPGYKAFRMFVLIPVLLRRMNADVVVEPAHFGPFNLPRKMHRVTVIHDLTPVLFPALHRGHSQLLQRIFLKGILKRASLIVTNSVCTLNDVNRLYPFTSKKTHAIHLGKDPVFRPTRDPSVLEKYKLTRPYFLFVGTIEPRKNLELLLKAFQILRERSQADTGLVIVGQRGWKTASFDKALDCHPFKKDIKKLGYLPRNELPVIFSSALGYIQPSLYEGFGIPVLEAMSCATPCIVSNVSSLPEIGGEAVLKFDSGDAGDLSGKMQLLLSDPQLRAAYAQKALERAEIFSWTSYARQFDDLLGGLTPGKMKP